MFNTGSWQTITKLLVESADSGLESADSSIDSYANQAKVGVWVWTISYWKLSQMGMRALFPYK